MKLTYPKVKAIYAEWRDGATREELARQYGLSLSTLRRYLRAYELYGRSYWTQYPERAE